MVTSISRRGFAEIAGIAWAAGLSGCLRARPTTTPLFTRGRQIPRVHDAGYRHWLYVPADYDAARPCPVVVFLHGSGERGSELDLVTKHGPPKLIAEGKQFPFIVVSPQCPTDDWWSECRVMATLDATAAILNVDPARVYLTGLSMGGYGTWEIAARYPARFAAIVPVCGGGDPRRFARRLVDVPTWAFHGDADTVVPVERSIEMVEAMRSAGAREVKLTVYPGVGHDSWTETYENPEVYEWLLGHVRVR